MSKVQTIQEDNYFEHPAISRSDLLLLERSPRLFKAYQNEEWERPNSQAFEDGHMIEERVLRPERFDNRYCVVPQNVEEPSHANHKAFCHDVIGGVPEVTAYLSHYTRGKKSDTVIDKEAVSLYEKYTPYINFQKDLGDRKTITQDQEQMLLRIESNIGTHINIPSIWEFDKRVQWAMVGEVSGIPVRVMHDVVIKDPQTKTFWLVDVKTTRHPLNEFHRSYAKYDYHVQCAMYQLVFSQWISDNVKSFPDWTYRSLVLVIEKQGFNEVDLFSIPPVAIIKGRERFSNLIELYKWHTDQNKWDHPKTTYDKQFPELPVKIWT